VGGAPLVSASRLALAIVWIAVTVGAFRAGAALHVRARSHPLVNAVVLAVVAIAALVVATRTPYATYAWSTRPIALLLGPATVALGLPLYRSLATLRTAARPVLLGLAAGGVVASASAMLLARALGASSVTVRSLAPKSVTTPIAMAIAARIGGDASLTAVFVIVTGMLGAMAVPGIFRWIGVDDARARGLAIGVAAHGLGTARALALGGTEGAFAALGMGLSGLLTPIVLPIALRLFG
jgi:predicted murein hydrolase (TIGR00659 family)